MTEGTGSLRIVPCEAAHADAALALLRSVMGETAVIKRSRAFWEWKHLQSPFGPSYGICAVDGATGGMVGLRMLMRWSFMTPDGRTVRAVRAVDTVTHPASRRRGVFERLTTQAVDDLTAEGVSLIFNTPNSRSLPGYLKMGWRVVGTVPVYLRILKPVRFVLHGAAGAGGRGELPSRERIFGPGVLTWEEFEKRHGDRWPALVAEAEGERPAAGYRTPRTAAYLRWRYGRHPHLAYGVFVLEAGGMLRGFAILKPNVRRGRIEAAVAELFAEGREPGLVERVLASMRPLVRADYLVASFPPRSREAGALRRGLFLRVPLAGIRLAARVLGEPPLDLFVPGHWDLALGDLEMF